MIRPPRTRIRYVEVFHVSQAVVRTHGSILGRPWRDLDTGGTAWECGYPDLGFLKNVWRVKMEMESRVAA